MEQKQTTLGPADMVRATQRANFWIRDILALAKNITEDARRTERLAKHKCKACFYRTRMAGQAFTERPCAICGSVEMYPSTHTDTCCLKCAQDRRICKECGGDIDMNPGRRDWSEEGGADQTPIPSHKGQIRE